jgi:hypothetical protein
MHEIDDMFIVQVIDRKIVIHTCDEIHIGSLNEQLEFILKPLGFIKADQNKFVQESKILTRDKKTRTLYFDVERKKSVRVTRPHIKNFFW